MQNSSAFYQILPHSMRNEQVILVLFHCSPWAAVNLHRGSIAKPSDQVLPASYDCGKHSQQYRVLYWQQYNQHIHTSNCCKIQQVVKSSLGYHVQFGHPSKNQTLIPEHAQRKPSKIEHIMYKQKLKWMSFLSLK